MNKQQTDFLLIYAKIGILSEKTKMDDIEYDEIKEKYISIKRELLESTQSIPEGAEKIKDASKPGEKKEGAVGKWLKGIGGRQRAYQEQHKEDII